MKTLDEIRQDQIKNAEEEIEQAKKAYNDAVEKYRALTVRGFKAINKIY